MSQGEEGIRKIYLGEATGGEQERQQFKPNYVSTTKYEWYDMVPKNLLEQFQRVANFWFLTVSVFQMLPLNLSPTSEYATLGPLCCVIMVTFVKDAWEDQLRRRDDFRMNNQSATVVVEDHATRDTCLQKIKWRDVSVGSYVQVERDMPIPADMILLSSSNDEDGTAFVDTAQLDGETSLKPKFPLEETMRLNGSEISALQGHIDSEQPNEMVQSFNGTLWLSGYPRGLPVEAKNFLLRGSTLRNTAWIYGVVVFTGVDTKLVQNSKRTPSKRSHVEKLANRLLLIVFAVLLVLAVAASCARAVWIVAGDTGRLRMDWVWPEKDPLQDNQYLALFTFLIGYNNLIPISLYVTTDLVRTFQGMMMEMDSSMWHEPTGSGCRVRNSGLCENLGQVEFVLSDKTGTLTENKMSFKACCIGTRVYGRWDQIGQVPATHVVQMPPSDICVPLDPNLWIANRAPRRAERSDSEKYEVDDFFLCLASCHTAIIEELPSNQWSPGSLPAAMQNAGSLQLPVGRRNSDKRRDSGGRSPARSPSGSSGGSPCSSRPAEAIRERPDPDLIAEAMTRTFRSSSPDEEALIAAARDHGYFFRKRHASKITINVRGKDINYSVLITNEFTSERKRMSVLVQRAPADNLTEEERKGYVEPPAMLYVKGADNIMLERLAKGRHAGVSGHGCQGRETNAEGVRQQLKKFSSCGLRTLILAKREVSAKDAAILVQKMIEAKNALINRENMTEAVADEMERKLQYVGITAIEDKIQEGVPKTIDMLLRAGIKVWMLTGDNMETAINIGIACRLTNADMRRYMLDVPMVDGKPVVEEMTPEFIERRLESFYKEIQGRLATAGREPFHYCVVVHGTMLYIIEDNDRLRQLFLAISCSSSSVIACRLAPAQKATLVQMVRRGLEGNPLTLAIGDGGNDVSMIQEAHVGVGLLGVEGRQAANAADFTIGQFRFLQTLLLVHGHWNLRRIGIVIAYSFYKNFILVLPMVQYASDTGFTGTTLYDSYLLTIFNLFFTSLPIIIMGVFDCDVSAKMALLTPSLYQLGINRCYFNRWMLIGWIARGMIHSMFIFVAMRSLFSGAMAMPSGDVPDYLVMGSWVYWTCVWVVNIILLLHTKAWMDWYFVVSMGSALLFIPILLLYSKGEIEYLNDEMVGVGNVLFGRPGSWFGLVLVVSSCALLDLAILFAQKVENPDASDILQEVQLGYLSGSDSTQLLSKYEAADSQQSQTCSRPSPTKPNSSADRLAGVITAPPGVQPTAEEDYIDDDFGEDTNSNIPNRVIEVHPPNKEICKEDEEDEEDEEGAEINEVPVGATASRGSCQDNEDARRRFNEVKEVLQRLPCPMPRMHKVKPLGNLYLEPLIAKTRSKPEKLQPIPSHGGVRVLPEDGGVFGIIPSTAASAQAVRERKVDEKHSWECPGEQSGTGTSSFYIREVGWFGRLSTWCKGYIQKAFLKQWCEMTVGDHILVPKHFKGPNRGSMPGVSITQGRASSQEMEMDQLKSLKSRSSDPGADSESISHAQSMGHSQSQPSMATSSSSLQAPAWQITASVATNESAQSTEFLSMSMGSRKSNDEIITQSEMSEGALSVKGARELMYSVVTLRFLSSTQEKSFGKYFSDHAVSMFQKSIICLSAAILLYNLYESIAYGWTIMRGIFCASILPAGCILLWALSRSIVARNAERCIILFILVVVTVKHFYDMLVGSDGLLGNAYMPVFIMAGVRIRIPGIGVVLVFHLLALLVHYWWGSNFLPDVNSRFSVLAQGDLLQAEYFVLMLGITFLSFYHAYLIEKLMRQDFIVLYSLKHSKYQAMEILKSMFPEEVVNHVIRDIQRNKEAKEDREQKELQGRSGKEAPSLQFLREDCGICTVVFCDVMDFANLVENLKPSELVNLLDSLWMIFDRLVQHNGLTKIETVGKTYMAAAMGNEDNQVDTGAVNAVLTSIAMLDTVEKRVLAVGGMTNVAVRIGIHTGPTMCGVVGSRKPQFALFGDTVNTAARMQSNGKENHVQVSGATHKYLQDDPRFSWTERQIQAKGKGTMDTYLLNRENLKRGDARRFSNTSRVSDARSPMGEASGALSPDNGSPFGRRLSSGGAMMRRNSSGSSRVTGNKRGSLVTSNTTSLSTAEGEVAFKSTLSEPPGLRRPVLDLEDDDIGQQNSLFHARQSMATLATTMTAQSASQARGAAVALTSLRLADANPIKSGRNLARYLTGQGPQRAQRDMITNVQDMGSIWLSFQLFLVCYVAESFCLLLGRQSLFAVSLSSDQLCLLGIRLGYLTAALAGSVMLHRHAKQLKWISPPPRPGGLGTLADHFTDIVAIIIFLGSVASTVSNVAFLPNGSEFWNVFEAFFFVMVLMHMYRTNLQGNVLIILCALVIIVAVVVSGIHQGSLMWECIVYSLLMTGTQMLAVKGDPRRYRYEHKAIVEENERINQLLDSMLPQELLADMKTGCLGRAYQYDNMTFMFADIVGFTSFCASHAPEQAVNLVTRLFAEFDEITTELQIYKVCTIGDAYVVVNEPRTKVENQFFDCERVYRLAERMIHIIIRVREQVDHAGLDMRIGLHCGSFVGGVIGTARVRFDIWGGDVNIGNTVESEGKAGQVCASAEAKQVLEKTHVGGSLKFTYHKAFELSHSKRVVQTYVIENTEGVESLLS